MKFEPKSPMVPPIVRDLADTLKFCSEFGQSGTIEVNPDDSRELLEWLYLAAGTIDRGPYLTLGQAICCACAALCAIVTTGGIIRNFWSWPPPREISAMFAVLGAIWGVSVPMIVARFLRPSLPCRPKEARARTGAAG